MTTPETLTLSDGSAIKDADAIEWLYGAQEEFMKPAVALFAADELAEYEIGDDCDPGYYCRLSAPGYLDATDWVGPFGSEAAALLSLYETYGND